MAAATQAPELRVLVHALDQAGDVLDHVHADDLEKPTPCKDWDVAALVDHLVAAPGNFLLMMRGGQADFSSPRHIEGSWGPVFRIHADDLLHAWHQLAGDPPMPVESQVAEFAVHTWDVAQAIGYPVERLDPEVATTALQFMSGALKPDMRGQLFDAERQASEGAGPYDALAAFAGRAV